LGASKTYLKTSIISLLCQNKIKPKSLCSASTPAVNATLLAFTADHRAAAAPLLLGAGRAAIDRYLLQQNPPHASAVVDKWHRQTNGHRTITQTLPHTKQAVPKMHGEAYSVKPTRPFGRWVSQPPHSMTSLY